MIKQHRTISTMIKILSVLGSLVENEKHSGLRDERSLFEVESEDKESNRLKLRASNFQVYSW